MSDNAKEPDLKTLIARDELTCFMDHLNVISPIPLSLIDNDGAVIYGNGSINREEKMTIDPADNGYRFPIMINNVQAGELLGHRPAEAQKDKVIESLKHIGEMLTDKLAYELKVDSLALEINNSYQELNLFYGLGDSLSSVLDVETICDIALKQAMDIIGSKSAFMMLLDAEKEKLDVVASAGFAGDLKSLQIKMEESICESVIQNKIPLVIEDLEKYPHLKGKISKAGILFEIPLICVPVIAKNEVLGMISMSGKLSGRSFTAVDAKLLSAIASQAGMSLGNSSLHEDLRGLFLNTVEALAAMVEAKDPYTHGHCRRVAEYSVVIGEEMGLPGKEINDLELAGILHDIGKIGVSESILRKPAELNKEELAEIRSHSVRGSEIIGNIEQMRNIALWIRHHHERYDGTGYPDGLSGEDIPFYSRILAVADTYDAVRSNRKQNLNHSFDTAVMELEMSAGSQLDPEIVNVFRGLLREDAYDKYLKAYKNYKYPPTTRLTRLEYYRIDNKITNFLARKALGNKLPESYQRELRKFRELILRY